MNFIDLAAQHSHIKEKIDSNIKTALQHGEYIMCTEVQRQKDVIEIYTELNHVVSCASETDVLLMAFTACNIGTGNAISTPYCRSLTWKDL